jgi:septal ring factor EnvC (AmiA/AmiB activator)
MQESRMESKGQVSSRNKKVSLALFPVIGFLTMGISMPSCPGQQALQQQIDALQARATETDQKIQGLTTQVNTLSKEMNDAKSLLEQVGQTVIAQKDAISALEGAHKALEEKVGKSGGAKKRK